MKCRVQKSKTRKAGRRYANTRLSGSQRVANAHAQAGTHARTQKKAGIQRNGSLLTRIHKHTGLNQGTTGPVKDASHRAPHSSGRTLTLKNQIPLPTILREATSPLPGTQFTHAFSPISHRPNILPQTSKPKRSLTHKSAKRLFYNLKQRICRLQT